MKHFSRASFLASALLVVVCVVTLAVPVIASAQFGDPSTGQNPSGLGNPSTGQNPSSGNKIPNPLSSNISDIGTFINTVLTDVVMPIAVVVIVLFIIYSGYLFVTAQGNVKKIEDARRTLIYVLIGAAILLGATVIAKAVQGTLCNIVHVVGCP